MSATSIEWTDATWNPVVGCSVVSPGCTNCYAMRQAARIERMIPALAHYQGLTQPSKAGPVWTGTVRQAPDRVLFQPTRWKKPRRVFVNSMSDLFHEGVSDDTIEAVFAVMALAGRHTFQILTKRAERMRSFMAAHFPQPGQALPNVWLGVSVEDQRRADERIPHLLATPAAARFISAEPLLGPLSFRWAAWADWNRLQRDGSVGHLDGMRGLHWVIAGGESGPGARPAHPDWFRALRDQCQEAGVPFFFKQWGEWGPDTGPPREQQRDRIMDGDARCAVLTNGEWTFHANGYEPDAGDGTGQWLYRLGKAATGARIDGELHREFPAR